MQNIARQKRDVESKMKEISKHIPNWSLMKGDLAKRSWDLQREKFQKKLTTACCY
jgi:hypothetical protein